MSITNRPHKRRLRLVAVLVTVVAVVVAAVVYVVFHLPNYRTAFLLDTSANTPSDAGAGSDFSAITDAVSSAAQNVGDRDALSLRRFGGACGDPNSTAQIVGSGTNHGQQVSNAVHTLIPGGNATLQSGILAAIDDFSGFYPFRGRKSNRIVVVTSHGTDACIHDQAALRMAIRDRMDAAALQLEFRFVGYKVPDDQQDTLAQVASATGAPEPRFVQTAADLTATLKQLTIPESPDAAPIKVPNTSIMGTSSPTVSSSPRESVVATSTEPPPARPDGQHFAYIKSLDVPARVIVIDEIQFLVSEEADAAAGEDRASCGDPGEPPVACNGYHIRNTNPRTYELQVSSNSTITINTLAQGSEFGESALDKSTAIPVTLEQLADLLAKHSTVDFPFVLTISGGRVTSLQERFVP